jgi:hypothetical protein
VSVHFTSRFPEREQRFCFRILILNFFEICLYPRKWVQFVNLVCTKSGFGGLEVACWPFVLKFAGSNQAEAVGFFGRKIPQHAFLQRGSKTVCPMSCFTACKRTQKWRGSRHFRQNSLNHFSPIVPPSAAEFFSVASDAGGLLWRKLERSKSLVLLQVGGLTCRWQRHSVKTFLLRMLNDSWAGRNPTKGCSAYWRRRKRRRRRRTHKAG